MSEETRLVIKSGNVFDSIEGKMKENLTIVVKNNEIAWVGDEGSFEKEETDNIIDAAGKTVLPGMVECHVHLSGTGDPQYEKEYLRTKRDMYNFIALDNAQKHLVSGFTCVRDAGSYKGIVSSLKRILNYGIFAGPRLVGSETGIWQWGDSESIGPQALVDFDREVSVIKAGVDNIKYAVRDQKRLG
ncbi:MAG: amidohydrolase family protein, partial [Candidatus Heimdallarchaeota archaeon]|nr:amidohydrolase family protein [Candidatus Heimdallarchaeota archaeon]MCK5144369.1 amidohydrolase family protein [Candidatus Heimdallarchaeota archaeon]